MDPRVVVFLCIFIAIVKTTKVDMSSEWKPERGWEITCSWKLFNNDSLQSVRLFENDRQFMIFRPEVDKNPRIEQYRRLEDEMLVECQESVPRGLVGTCVLTMEFYQPPTNDFRFSCEASGERPMFRMERKSLVVKALVPPTDAVIEVGSRNADTGRVTLNCTSSGLPAPQLEWRIGEQKVPADFSNRSWNFTSKLYHVWSVVSYSSSEHVAMCIPETSKDGETKRGAAALYSSAESVVKD
ncbi:uncharacterized protein LOC142976906 isoform X2 [Anticarsia gemmatalis]